jgi:hypothetical protein
MNRLLFLAIALVTGLLSSDLTIPAQTSVPPGIDEIVARAAQARSNYLDVFKNLLSRETRTFEIYDKRGELKHRRVIVSTFLVYQLTKESGRISEFRNVSSVDGKLVDNNAGRTQSLFEAISSAETSDKELARIEAESQRFDEDISVTGQTLFQAVTLSDNLRPYFEFKLDGIDSIEGNAVYIVSYQQARPTPYVTADPQRLPGERKLSVINDAGIKTDGDLNARLSGKLMIDAATFQIRRELRNFTVQPGDFKSPVLLAQTTFEYNNSEFGILVPTRLTHLQYAVSERDKSSRKQVQIVFQYENFTRPDVEVKSAEVKSL